MLTPLDDFYVIVLIWCAHKWWYSVHWILRLEIHCTIYFPIMWISRKKAMLIFPLWINVRSLNAYIIHILFIHAIYYFKEKSHLKHSILPHTTYVGYSVERKCNVFVERICNIKDEAYCLKSCVIFFLSIMIQFVIGSKCGSMQDVIYVKTYASSDYSFCITLSRQDISQSNSSSIANDLYFNFLF